MSDTGFAPQNFQLSNLYKIYNNRDNEVFKDIKDDLENLYSKIQNLNESNIRLLVRKLLQEADKKSYSGSHPEESYGWSAKEEHFMFDMPGLTTWEEDRQRVKEYLRSMGMLEPKKEKKK